MSQFESCCLVCLASCISLKHSPYTVLKCPGVQCLLILPSHSALGKLTIVFVKSYFPHWTTNFLSCSGFSCFLVYGRKFEMGERRAKCVHLIQYLAKQVENSSATGEQSRESHSTATNVSGVGWRHSGAGRGITKYTEQMWNWRIVVWVWLGISQQNICASVSKTGAAWDRRLHLLGFYPSFVKVSFTLSDSPSQYRVPQPSARHTAVLSPIEALYKSAITPEESPLSPGKYPAPWRPQKINGAVQQDVFGIWSFLLRKVCLRFSRADMPAGSS